MGLENTMAMQIGFETISDKKEQKNSFGFYMTPIDAEDLNPYGLTMDEEELVNLADDMASAMTDLNAHNYKSFVETRDRFRAKIKSMGEKVRCNEEKIAKIKRAVAEI